MRRNELPIEPAPLPGSRISETRETTRGSAELKFRIQFPPAASHLRTGIHPRIAVRRRSDEWSCRVSGCMIRSRLAGDIAYAWTDAGDPILRPIELLGWRRACSNPWARREDCRTLYRWIVMTGTLIFPVSSAKTGFGSTSRSGSTRGMSRFSVASSPSPQAQQLRSCRQSR